MLDLKALQRELTRLGWRIESDGGNTFRSVRDTAEGALTIFARLTENWLIASVVPFLSTGGHHPFELSRWLLRMNHDMVQAKFAYDEDGDVVLSIEWPTESLDSAEIQLGLRSLVDYSVKYRRILREAST